MKFRTEKECFHNGKYYKKGDIVECDCKFCKEKSVPYFKEVEEKEEKNVSQETITEKKINNAEESVKEIKKAFLDEINKNKKEVKEEIKEEAKEVSKEEPKKKSKLVVTE